MPPVLEPTSLPDLSDDQPAGENLEFDPAFAELERLAAGKPEQQYGSTIVPAEEPDWKAVIAAAEELTQRTYDLRVMSVLAVAQLQRNGLPAYATALQAIRSMLDDRWAAVHPQLDPEDDDDPTLRGNALLALADPVRVIRLLRNLPLARSSRAGPVSWRDISIGTGALEVDDGTVKLSAATIDGAFRESDPVQAETLRAAIAAAIGCTTAIPATFDSNAGPGTGPDFTDLTRQLRDMGTMIDNHAQPRELAEVEPAADDAGPVDAPARPAAPRAAPVFSIASMGPPTTREDAVRLLELVVAFYEQNEPSSPLPLLIARAVRLADKGFMDILRDMAPDGVQQAERIAGITNDGY